MENPMKTLSVLGLAALLFVAGCGNNVATTFTREVADCAGTFGGTFSGDDTGLFMATMSPDGSVTGTLVSALAGIANTSAIVSPDGSFLGVTNIGTVLIGQLDNACAITGTWENDSFGLTGNWSATLQSN